MVTVGVLALAVLGGCGGGAESAEGEGGSEAVETAETTTTTAGDTASPGEPESSSEVAASPGPTIGKPVALALPGATAAVAFSPDSALIATAGTDGLAIVRDVETGEEVVRLTRFERPSDASPNGRPGLAFSPDGSVVAFTTATELVLYNLETGRPAKNFKAGASAGFAGPIAYSPDGGSIAAILGRTVGIWDLETGQQTATLSGHGGDIQDLAYSPDGSLIATASRDETVIIWDAASGRSASTVSGFNGRVLDVAFSSDGRRLAVGSLGGLRIVDADSGAEIVSSDLGSNYAWSAAFGPDPATVVVSTGSSILTLDADTLTEVAAWSAGAYVQALTVSPDGAFIAATSVDDSVALVWNAADGTQVGRFVDHHSDVHAAAFSPDGTQVAIGGTQRDSVAVFDAVTGEELATLEGSRVGPVWSLAYSPDGALLAAGTGGALSVALFDVAAGRPFFLIEAQNRGTFDVAWVPDGSAFITANGDGTVSVWDTETRTVRSSLTGHTGAVSAVAVSPDGTAVVSAGSDGQVIAWDLATGAQLRTFPVQRANDVAFSPDGAQIVTAGRNVQIWDVETAELSQEWANVFASRAVFSPDGTQIGMTGGEGLAQIVVLENGRQEILSGHGARVNTLRFSPDGTRVVTGGNTHPTALLHLLEG